jgi:hypothetical protein
MSSFKYLVDLELRYIDEPRDDGDYPDYVSKTITVGIYDTYEEAVQAGNVMLETELESKFPLNKNYNKKNRFGETYTKYLISDLAYLTTPFSFFAHIKKLQISPIGEAVDEALNAERRYKEWKKTLDRF